MARRNRALQIGGLLVAVLVLATTGWWLRDHLGALLGGEPEPVAVSPEAAEQAEGKLQRLRDDGEEVSLSEVELSSLLRYRAPAGMAELVRDPAIRLAGDTLVLSGAVPTDRLPSHPDLDQVRAFLPDTSSVEVSGRLRPLDDGRAALEIDELELAGFPVPRRFYADVLRRIGRRDQAGLGPTAIGISLPAGAASARIEGGRLILTP